MLLTLARISTFAFANSTPRKLHFHCKYHLRYSIPPLLFAIYSLPSKCISQSISSQTIEPQPNHKLATAFKYICRVAYLTLIFLPVLICLPLNFFKCTQQAWLSLFLFAIESAGLVWIKMFQYLSHRRDIIGQEMAKQFSILRQNSPSHSWQETKQIIKRMFGDDIENIFQEISAKPIASGSVSQIYKAKFHGKNVAVKVRHPNVQKHLEIDIQILFFFSKMLSVFSNKFEVPVTHDSLINILREQVYFSLEKANLDKFNKLTIHESVRFPFTYPQSKDEVLIEEFIDGKTIGFYENHKHELNQVIAMIGAKSFFSMLMKYNFVHADCHAGNILVSITSDENYLRRAFRNTLVNVKNYITSKIVKYYSKSEVLSALSHENYLYEKSIQKIAQQHNSKVEIILIDVGMSIQLTKQKKQSFQSFLSEIIQGNPLECAKWIFKISTLAGKQLKQDENRDYFNDLHVMFKRVHQISLENLDGLTVLNEMLGIIRQHHMIIDGQISILLTNMLVLEAIAKDLDPQINILRCGIPYLHYQ